MKTGELLFKAGDAPNGVYIIRRGEVLVFLDGKDHDVPLAMLSSGGMVGEMALFDQKPRSASARAVGQVEVTHISAEEFGKILQQVPKWLVVLMSTLSRRLRDTNERLRKLESKYYASVNPFSDLIKTLNILELLWHKNGVKEAKNWLLDREMAEQEIATILDKTPARVAATIQALIAGELVTLTQNSYKKPVLSINTRGELERFIQFIDRIHQRNPNLRSLPQEFLDMADTMSRYTKANGYETFSVDLKALESEAKNRGIRTELWANIAPLFLELDPSVSLHYIGKDVSFKIQKRGLESMFNSIKLIFRVMSVEAKQVAQSAA